MSKVAGKVHLLSLGHSVRLACSPPWVDSQGKLTVTATFVLADVTCLGCRRTALFKKLQELEERSNVGAHVTHD